MADETAAGDDVTVQMLELEDIRYDSATTANRSPVPSLDGSPFTPQLTRKNSVMRKGMPELQGVMVSFKAAPPPPTAFKAVPPPLPPPSQLRGSPFNSLGPLALPLTRRLLHALLQRLSSTAADPLSSPPCLMRGLLPPFAFLCFSSGDCVCPLERGGLLLRKGEAGT
eukprot:CAMPEP_0117675444 /NCGR_PEP_ID=MMETSP0804-20121206/15607_1 /TAXON_ID=1074897 /ORGANISM="Tetraselmis astigmatica, Strain CCMP880" /LENGTH=167 /DNA_ID=CAMNT_0005484445 /DNA_START=238 /DNA_END=738 /DNA_ORIENTATION=-